MKIITSEGLNPSLLADEMGVQRSGISHILSGRNYPSFDFLQKLLTRFPKLNAEWFILGQGSMYKSAAVTELPDLFVPEQKTPLSPTLPKKPEISNPKPETQTELVNSPKANPTPETLSSEESVSTESFRTKPEIIPSAKTNKVIDKIIILYTDKTFASYFAE